MRKMKDSGIEWIGEIPEGWEVVKAKYLFAQRNEKGNSALVLLSPTQKYGVIPQSQLEGVVQVKENTDLRTFKTIHIGDFVISLRSFQGGFEFSNYEGVCSPAYQVLHATKDLSNDFFRYLFKSDGFISKINSLTVGIREGKNIQYWDFSNMLLALPPKEIQIRSAQYLNAKCTEIDTMLSKTRSSIEEYKKLKQAVITQAVTKGVRGEREMKDSGVDYIGQIPAEWVLGKLRNVGDTQNGISKSSEFFGKGFPFVSYSDVYKNYSLPSTVSGLVDSTSEEQKRYSVKKGDIFFTRTSETIEEVGFSCVCEKDIPNATFAGFLIRVRPFSDKLYTPYAKYYFRSSHLRFYLVKEMNLVTRASRGPSLLKSMPVLLPPLEEQKEIADYLDTKYAEIDGLIAKKDQLVKELESYKKSLIYEVVTGKREV